MRAGWRNERLSAVCELIARGIAPAYIETGGIRVVNQKCVRDHAVDYALARRHDNTVRAVAPERLIRAGDVLVNSTGTGTLGRVAQVLTSPDEPTTVDTHVTIVRPAEGLFHPSFFGYAMMTIEAALAAGGEGASGQTELPRSKLANDFKVSFPTHLADQQRIVAILDEAFEEVAATVSRTEAALEKAISLSAATIESLAASDELITSSRSVGELIEQGVLERISDGNHGEIHPTKDEFVPQGVPFIMASDLRDGRVDQEGCRFISEDRARSLRVGFARDGDVLLSHKGTIGRVATLSTDRPYVMLTPQVTYYRVKDRTALRPQYLYHALRGRKFQEQLREIAGLGSTRAYIGITRQLDLLLTIPSIGEQERLATIFDQVDREAQLLEGALTKKLTLLAELKQSLLACAFSGELTREPLAA